MLISLASVCVATVLTVYGIETQSTPVVEEPEVGCNSTYRLRY